MESTIKYRFAYDENDCVVKIDEITENDRENHKYHCISCGNEMIAKLGILKSATIIQYTIKGRFMSR